MATGAIAIGGMLMQSFATAAVGAAAYGAIDAMTGGGSGGGGGLTSGMSMGGSGASSGVGMMSSFGQAALQGAKDREEAEYNAKMAEVEGVHRMNVGAYRRDVSYKEAQLVKQDAELKLATLRRELYRKQHSLKGHKGVRLDSGSIVDVKEDMIKQANYDAEIVKYQADIDAGRHTDQGDMSLWSGHSDYLLAKNRGDSELSEASRNTGTSLLSNGLGQVSGLMK